MKKRPPIQEVFNEAMANVLGLDIKAIKIGAKMSEEKDKLVMGLIAESLNRKNVTVLEALMDLLCDESRIAWEAGSQNCMGPISPEQAEGKLRAILQEIGNLRIPQ
jgi:hypothetical protein